MGKVNTKIIVIPKKNARMVAEILCFGAGWRNDPPDRQGLSHFLEHVIASDDVDRIMKIRYYGGERIAQTSADFIRGMHYVPKFVWKENLIFLLDYLYKTEIRQTKVDSQKKFLAKEITHWNSFPHNQLLKKIMHLTFYPHPYSNRSSGKVEDIKRITLSLLEHFRRCFWGDIMILVEGDVNEHEVREVVNKYFEKRKVETEVWEHKEYSFPENGKVKKEIEIEGSIKYLAFGGMIKEPNTEDILSLYILSFLFLINDSELKKILNKARVPAVSTQSSVTPVFLTDASAFVGTIVLEKELKSVDFSSVWYALSKEFNYLKEKVLIYQEVQDLWSEADLRSRIYFSNRDYDDFVDKLNNIDSKTFLNVYEKLDREAIILTRRKT